MYLNYFTEEAYGRLWNDVDKNADKYRESDAWIEDYFGHSSYYKTSKSVNVNSFVPCFSPGTKTDAQKAEEDLINTRLMYDAFKSLSPLQATNRLMWTYLCHADDNCRKYIIDRWMMTERENTIRKRFFVRGNSDLLNDNALARLWWYGYLTYDEKNANHYELTEILLMNQTICTDIIDTMNRMNFNRLKGVLLAIKDMRDEVGDKEGMTNYVRTANKLLNHYAASTTMEMLTSEEIKDIYLGYLKKARSERLGE